MLRRSILFACLAMLACAGAASRPGHVRADDQPRSYTVTDIGSFGGDTLAGSLNDAGDAVGVSYTVPGYGGQQRGYLWHDGALTDLGPIANSPLPINNAGQFAFLAHTSSGNVWTLDDNGTLTTLDPFTPSALNGSGEIAGYEPAAGSTYHAALYQGGTIADLGSLGGSIGAFATDVNDSDVVVGDSTYPGGGGRRHAFRYVPGTGMDDLGTLGGDQSSARLVNASGDVTGWAMIGDGSQHAYLFAGGTMHDLGDGGGIQTDPLGLNDNDVVVGTTTFADNKTHGFYYANGTTTDATPNASSGNLRAVNDSGVAVGDNAYSLGGAMVYADGIPRELSTITQPGGYHIIMAFDINAAGQILAESISPTCSCIHTLILTPSDVPVETTPPTVTSANDGATYEQGDVVSTQYSCQDTGGSLLAACNGTVANGSPLDTSTVGTHSYDVTAVDNSLNTTTQTFSYTVVAPVDQVTDTAPPGGSVSTDVGAPGPSATDPVATTITVPDGGPVSIDEDASASAPTGYTLVGQPVQISAPDASVSDPLVVSFSIDRSVLDGADATDAAVFRNGVEALPCTGPGATPDPCVLTRTRTPDSDAFSYVTLTILTSHASTWVTALHQPYTFGGFYAPVRTPKLNTMPAGSGLKLKFSLGGNQGLRIFAAGSPSLAAVTCPSLRPFTVTGTVAVAKPKLRYVASSGRYVYSWKSPATTGCYDLTFRFIDGSSHVLHFKLT